MLFSKVLYSYIEGMKGEKVIWYEDNYNDVKNGKNGHHQHPEVETHLNVVKQAIEHPNEVKRRQTDDSGLFYYAWYTGGKDYPNHHMKAVIRRTVFGRLKVVTAYFVLSFSQSEENIWSKT